LKANLAKDLVTHGNPEQHKRFGDLLLANIATATRKGRKVTVQDYYQDGAPMIEIEVDEEKTLPEQAAEYFSRFTKAKRASEEIAMRVTQVDRDLASLEEKQNELTTLIEAGDIHALRTLVQAKQKRVIGRSKKEKSPPTLPGMRRYLSSDGYEVIVGRTARDNDALTFRVARPNDLWLHAGDYPGSHVIVRNSSRKDIPHRTLVEAAQLAAKFSQASKDSKVTIHYSARKFLSKPKGAAPGLVRMSNYKTINVAPGENIERLK
jgi:predicted ribosome quality control (RQC) complex YloA/Tae2 family protein